MTNTKKPKRPKNVPKKKEIKWKVLNKTEAKTQPSSCVGSSKCKRIVRLPEQYNEMRKENKLCDGLIFSKEGKQFAVHKLVIFNLGSYFKRLFQNSRNGKFFDNILLPIPDDIIECFIDFAYTGECNITLLNVKSLLCAANSYGVTAIVANCCEFLYENMNCHNCVRIYRAIKNYICPEWKSKILRYICHHFGEIKTSSSEFGKLSSEELRKILIDDELNVRHEDQVFEAIVRWIQKSSRHRQDHLPRLINCPRYAYMSYDYFTEKVMQYYYVKKSLQIQEMLFPASMLLAKTVSGERKGIDINEPLLARPRIPYSILFVIGGWTTGKPTNMIETYDIKANRWYLHEYSDEQPIAYHGTCVVNNLIYVIGGFNGKRHCNNVRCYNPVTHKWRECSGMFYKRCYVSTCALDGKIYALGGFNGHLRLTHGEVYDPQRNQWSLLPDMRARRSDASATSMNGKVYVAGGYNGHQILRSMEYYNPETKEWTFVIPMSRLRCGLSLVTWNNRIYAIGGSNGVGRFKDAEYYDGQGWHDTSEMHQWRSNASVAVLDDYIYIMGGYDGKRTLDSVECFDPSRDIWTNMRPSHMLRSAASACVVSGLPNAREYSYLKNSTKTIDVFYDIPVKRERKQKVK